MKPIFFESPAEMRSWLEANHDTAEELWVGYHKKGTGRRGISWSESVDQAICFGWIDGIRKSIDAASYTNRFTPRKNKSIWSAVNIKKAEDLITAGLMHPAGLAMFEARDDERSAAYSYEQKNPKLGTELEREFKADRKAWAFFQAQSPSYRKTVTWWVMSAKRDDTRRRRLAILIDDSRKGLRVDMLRPGRRRS
jgi:uncharacterized protein YdeI (YjbR/CyaY-like superfamily)